MRVDAVLSAALLAGACGEQATHHFTTNVTMPPGVVAERPVPERATTPTALAAAASPSNSVAPTDGAAADSVQGDFNFDGHLDLAVQDGNDGPYGSPSYSILLFNSATSRLEHSAALSALSSESSGLPELDASNRRIRTSYTFGCCVAVQSEYVVVDDLPVLVRSSRKDFTGPSCVLNLRERRPDGTWAESRHAC